MHENKSTSEMIASPETKVVKHVSVFSGGAVVVNRKVLGDSDKKFIFPSAQGTENISLGPLEL
jgi:hypothetical protein